MKQIAIYGKGGIGKSTIASNLSAALNEMGQTVMQVGCDPKRDSTRILAGGRFIPAVLEEHREKLRVGKDEYAIDLDRIVYRSPGGIYLVEAGGPEPGVGCAGRGVLTALQILKDLDAFETYGIDVAIYDVLGDVVCGGFSMPIREGFAREIYLVCSGGFMSIYAANNIARAVQRLGLRGDTGLAGIVCNSNGDEALERAVIPAFAQRLGTAFVQFVPRSPVIQAGEMEGRAVVEYAPDSREAEIFRNLARAILANDTRVIPTPIAELAELETMYREHLVKK
ncbi:MAG: AAA family ATPase [Methanomicrobiales archaeon]|nr:AAA family ATPase [Methanomicrobiales archaeon]MDI6877651.1 AAA family ATPase [Methanomicrobiales archaeon]